MLPELAVRHSMVDEMRFRDDIQFGISCLRSRCFRLEIYPVKSESLLLHESLCILFLAVHYEGVPCPDHAVRTCDLLRARPAETPLWGMYYPAHAEVVFRPYPELMQGTADKR